MKLYGLLLTLALASGSAHAGWGDENNNTNHQGQGQLQGQAQGQLQGQAQGQGQHQNAEANAGAIAGASSHNRNTNANLNANRNSQRTNVGVHSANVNLNGAASFSEGGDASSYSEGSRASSGSYSGDVTNRNRIRNNNDSSAYVEGDTITDGDVSTTFYDGDVSTLVSTGDYNDGDQTVDAGDVTIQGDTVTSQYREAASTAIAGYGNTTASCFRTLGVGGSTRSSSWSLGLPLKDKDCELGEDAAQAFMVGAYATGWKLYCEQKPVRKVYGGKFMNRQSHQNARVKCYNEAMEQMSAQAAQKAEAQGMADKLAAVERELQTMKDAEAERRMNEVIGTRADLEALGVVKK